jgi:hypothetical protein
MQPRERASGRFGYTGDFGRLCRCRHPLGIHAGEAPHPCFNEDAGIEGASGESCECMRFALDERTKAAKANGKATR